MKIDYKTLIITILAFLSGIWFYYVSKEPLAGMVFAILIWAILFIPFDNFNRREEAAG